MQRPPRLRRALTDNAVYMQGSGYFLAIGAPCSGGKLHFHGTAVNILMHGAKRWSIFRPSHVGSAYCGSPGPQFIEEQVWRTLTAFFTRAAVLFTLLMRVQIRIPLCGRSKERGQSMLRLCKMLWT